MGAEFGYSMLWVVVVAIFFMVVFTSMAGRIGLATHESFLSCIRNRWGRGASVATGLGVFLVTASFQAGNSVGVGIAMAGLFDTGSVPWIILFNMFGLILLFYRSFYKILETVMIALICLMLLAFVSTLFLSGPSVGRIVSGLIPQVPAGGEGLLVAFIASCFSVVGACYQSYLVQEKNRVRPDVVQTKHDSVAGILILGLMSAMVLLCCAAVLKPQGIEVSSAADMAKVLEPSLGRHASSLFLFGLFAASFSSLIGNASVGGTLMSDALGRGSQFASASTRLLIAAVMIIGACVAIIFGKLPLELIVFAQLVTIFVVPFIGITLVVIANDRKIMGDLQNTFWTKLFAAAGLLLLFGLAIVGARSVFF